MSAMKRIRETPVPIPGPQSKNETPRKPSKPPKSSQSSETASATKPARHTPVPLPSFQSKQSAPKTPSSSLQQRSTTTNAGKIRQTPVQVPVSQLKSKTSKTPVKPPLSQEFVHDSSDESAAGDAPQPKTKKTLEKKSKTTSIAVHRPKVNGVAKQSKVALPKKIAVPLQRKAEVSLSPALKTGEKSSESESSSSEESAEEGSKSEAHTPSEKSENDNDSESESESTSGSSSDESEDNAVSRPTSSATKEQSRPSQSHTVAFHPPEVFKPPKDFENIPTPLSTSSKAVNLFKDVEGKQIWHFTAPAGVPLWKLEAIAMDRVRHGDTILMHKNAGYRLKAETEGKHAREVLIPQQDGYKAVSARISQTLHLEEAIQLPELSLYQTDQNTGSAAAASITASTIRAPRPQLKGLRMRYFHSGFGDEDPGILGSSESEDEESATARLGIPNGAPALNKPEKRKQDDVHGIEPPESPTKKHKKHRTPEEIRRREEKKAKKERKREKHRAKS